MGAVEYEAECCKGDFTLLFTLRLCILLEVLNIWIRNPVPKSYHSVSGISDMGERYDAGQARAEGEYSHGLRSVSWALTLTAFVCAFQKLRRMSWSPSKDAHKPATR